MIIVFLYLFRVNLVSGWKSFYKVCCHFVRQNFFC